ncbi:MAG: hypothetical protein ABIY55_29495 [Kofleriaceae bacterium]
MRFACLLIVLAACGGPITPPYATPSRAPGAPDPKVLRPPVNAPPDPIGTTRPGNRSCTENRDCKVGETCFAPDYVPPPALSAAGSAAPLQCQGDAQCTQGLICATGACVAPCAEGSCGPGLECRTGGRCMPIACSAPQAAVCAQNFRCGGSGACERQACTSRAQCDSGACFQGRCFAHDAYCMPQNSPAPQ